MAIKGNETVTSKNSKRHHSKRNHRRLLAIVMALSLFTMTSVRGEEIISYGGVTYGKISHYNGIVFGDFIGDQADSEGPLAIQGNARFGSKEMGHSFSVGAAYTGAYNLIGSYTNPNGWPTIVLGGEIDTDSTNLIVLGGDAVLKNSYYNDPTKRNYIDSVISMETKGTSIVPSNADEDLDKLFVKIKEYMLGISERIMNAEGYVATDDDIDPWTGKIDMLDAVGYGETNLNSNVVAVFDIDRDMDSTVIEEIHLPQDVVNYDHIIINIESTNVTFKNGGLFVGNKWVLPSGGTRELFNEMAEKIIWNLPNAENIEISNCAVVGSMLSPNAALVGDGGSLNGVMVIGSLVQKDGFELHSFSINNIDDLADLDVINPEETEKVEESDAPEETEKVEESDAPEETEKVEESDAPEETERVEESDAPEETDTTTDEGIVVESEEPEVTEEVVESEEPEATEEVVESEEVDVTEVPVRTIGPKPIKTLKPIRTPKPIVTIKPIEPGETAKPIVTEPIDTSEEPASTESDQPSSTDDVTESDQPGSTDDVTESDKPDSTKTPVVTDAPKETDEVQETDEPKVTESITEEELDSVIQDFEDGYIFVDGERVPLGYLSMNDELLDDGGSSDVTEITVEGDSKKNEQKDTIKKKNPKTVKAQRRTVQIFSLAILVFIIFRKLNHTTHS